MTAEEAIKAMECCIIGDCGGCMYGETDQMNCRDKLMQDALDLINRQQAEIERLKDHIGSVTAMVRVEAIKDFAERLKNEIISDTAYGCDSNQHSGYYDYTIKIGDIPEYIDNLVKEIAGE